MLKDLGPANEPEEDKEEPDEEELEKKPLRGKSFEANNVKKEKQMMMQGVTI